MPSSIKELSDRVVQCRLCPRLVTWCKDVAAHPRASYREDVYWGKPVPGFGDPNAAFLLVGLAPGAHGANRTGRMFTGDRSGEWLYRALYRAGFASQPESTRRGDGLRLRDAYVTAVVRCAPPANHPTPAERDACMPFLKEELERLGRVTVILALGSFAWDGCLRLLSGRGHSTKPKPRFAHGAEAVLGPYRLLGSYHPSQQNTFTGKLTEPMFDSVFRRARELIFNG